MEKPSESLERGPLRGSGFFSGSGLVVPLHHCTSISLEEETICRPQDGLFEAIVGPANYFNGGRQINPMAQKGRKLQICRFF